MDFKSLNTEDVDRLLHQKRKHRGSQACYPCRRRKVKCDNQVPCEVCRKRNHVELCTYEPSSKAMRTGDDGVRSASSGGHPDADEWMSPTERARSMPAPVPALPPLASSPASTAMSVVAKPVAEPDVAARLASMEATLAAIQVQLTQLANRREPTASTPGSYTESTPVRAHSSRSTDARRLDGLHASDQNGGERVYLGGSSMPAFVLGHNRDNGRMGMEKSIQDGILPIFGLQDAASDFPLYNVWTPDNIMRDIYAALPSDTEALRLLDTYRELLHRVHPYLTDVDEFELQLRTLLEERALHGFKVSGQDWEKPELVERVSWLALLFSVLASGTQLSDNTMPNRDNSCRRFASYSFQCLRMVNFFVRPSFNVLQALLLLGNVLQNQQNPGVAWVLLGITIRLCQTIGIHRDIPQGQISPSTDQKRRRIWWLIVRTDSFLSVMYDRPPAVGYLEPSYPFPQLPSPSYSYLESHYRLCELAISILQKSLLQLPTNELIEQLQYQHSLLDVIITAGYPHLRDTTRCRSTQDRIEHAALRMHFSFFTAWLYRPALSLKNSEAAEDAAEVTHDCVQALGDTMRWFLRLRQLTIVTTRIWTFMHAGLNSALLLGILGEGAKNDEIKKMQGEVIAVFESEFGDGEPSKTRPLARALTALRNLRQYGTLGEPQQLEQRQQLYEQQQQEQNLGTTPTTAVAAAVSAEQRPTSVAGSSMPPPTSLPPQLPAEDNGLAHWGDTMVPFGSFQGGWPDSNEFAPPNDVLNSILYGQTMDDPMLPGQEFMWSGWSVGA